MSRPEDFFALNEVTGRRLLLVGYRLFPATDLLLHPRMTVLSGNNAVGKTTILDAIQTIFICHLGHINLNVASGHSDRNLSGQLAGHLAWACLEVTGHERTTGIGVRLRKKPGSEGVELSPFVLQGATPELRLFLDPGSGRITQDLQHLGQQLLQTSATAKVLPFDSVDKYHGHLHEEGLFPIDLSGAGKRLFSNLWRQVSQPRLDRLQRFLEDMLCPRSQVRKLGFEEVDRLIKDRRSIEQRLKRLEEFRELRSELEEKVDRLERNRQASLGLSLALARQRVRSLQERQRKDQVRESELWQKLQSLDQDLAQLNTELETKRKERDKCLGRQTDLTAQRRHYQEYQQAQAEIPDLKVRMSEAADNLNRHLEEVEAARSEQEGLTGTMAGLEKDLAVGREREKTLYRDLQQWKAMRELAEQCGELFQTSLESKEAFQALWRDFQGEWQAFRSLDSKKRELVGLDKRKKNHQAALKLRQGLSDCAPELEVSQLQPEVLQQSIKSWKQRMQDLWEEQRSSRHRIEALRKVREQLAKGRPPLPDGAEQLVEAGLAKPFAARFEHLDLEEAAHWQARIGPFAKALEPAEGTEASALAQHQDPYLVVTKGAPQNDSDWEVLAQTEQGVLAGRAGLAWYSPQGPVWLGVQARSRQMGAMKEELQELEGRLAAIQEEEEALRAKESKAGELLSFWEALLDTRAPGEHEALAREISRLEEQGPVIQKKNRLLNRLLQHVHAFELSGVQEELEALRKELQEKEHGLQETRKRLEDCSTRLQELRAQEKDRRSAWEALRQELSRREDRCEVLRQEEPLEVLEGHVDFGREAELLEQLEMLGRECSRLEGSRDELRETRGGLKNELAGLADSLAETRRELERARHEADRAEQDFRAQYPDRELPVYTKPSESDRQKALAGWEQIRNDLRSRLDALSRKFELPLPRDTEPDRSVAYILESLLPPQVDLDNQEEKLRELRAELAEVEKQIRAYVEQIRKSVDQEIHRLDRRVYKVNRILETMSFGKISRINLKRELLPAYEGLKNLSGTRLTLLQLGQEISLQDFVRQIRETIVRYGRTTLDEDEILDYRSYIRLSWSIEDEDGNQRHSGFSGGEGLGVNLAICLSLLFYFGQDQGIGQGQGVLVMALDEAERLDDRSLTTIRHLLDQVCCQLVVALPRTIHIPSSICHMLTPLSQGVTHISVYHQEAEASGVQP
jgi:chromosome partition protein MukB